MHHFPRVFHIFRFNALRISGRLKHGVFLAFAQAVFAVTALSIGEISAGKLVATPDAHTLAQEIFIQMHFGVQNRLAATCLLLLAAIAVPAVVKTGTSWTFHLFKKPCVP